MTKVLYDGSFAGLLTAIFETYEHKFNDASVCRSGEGDAATFFSTSHVAHTDFHKAERVWKKLQSKMSSAAITQFYRCFLSEEKGVEDCLLRYTRYTLSSARPIENDFGHPDVLKLQQTGRKVYREKHRMEAFVRFQLTSDGLYYSVIQPDHNVLPLVAKHFKDRYADQRWLIYDVRRKYGIYYDLKTVEMVEIDLDRQKNFQPVGGEEYRVSDDERKIEKVNDLRLDHEECGMSEERTKTKMGNDPQLDDKVCQATKYERKAKSGNDLFAVESIEDSTGAARAIPGQANAGENFLYGKHDNEMPGGAFPEGSVICLDENEALCQQLWRQYFSSVNIPERKNMKLHIRHMPKRYWRYLTEKNGPINNPDMQFL